MFDAPPGRKTVFETHITNVPYLVRWVFQTTCDSKNHSTYTIQMIFLWENIGEKLRFGREFVVDNYFSAIRVAQGTSRVREQVFAQRRVKASGATATPT